MKPDSNRPAPKGELTILRLDYGIGQGQWRDTKTVANEVTVTIDILAKRPMP